tara:strand:- start:988 stop:1911 length:924 start_codon:yes stop_codon:yes gene_type:complete
MSAIKISVQAPEKDWVVSSQKEEILIGRGGDVPVDIQIPDPTVTRCHGRIWLSSDGYWYEDNNSTHGSQKNDAHLIGPVRIFSGDILKIGESALTIEQADASEGNLNLNELFDVHLQDRLHLDKTGENQGAASTRIKVIGQKAYQEDEKPDTEIPSRIFGGLVNIFGYEGLNDALCLAIEDIVGQFKTGERGCILLLENSGTELVVAANYPLFEPAFSTSLANKTIEQQRAFIWSAEEGTFSSASLKKLNIKAGMYSPLVFGPNPLGLICIDSTSIRAEFNQKDLNLFVNVSQVLSALIAAKKKEEA